MNPEYFVGRTSELDSMQAFFGPGSKRPQQQQLLALSGVGGIGKTQLAIAYANRHCDLYTSILWLDASSEPALCDSFRSVFESVYDTEAVPENGDVEDEEALARIFKWLSDINNPQWLMILDNLPVGRYNIEKYYPPASHGDIIVTTSGAHAAEFPAGMHMQLQPFENIQDSLALLQHRSKREDVETGRVLFFSFLPFFFFFFFFFLKRNAH